jgi:hypothetical protein
MITVELTETQIEHLLEGAEQYGRCSMILEAKDGISIIVAVHKNNRRGRPRKTAEPVELDRGDRLAEPA